MRSSLKKYLPKIIINFLNESYLWNHNPYSLKKINLDTNLSDFFIWSNECSKIEFMAENIRALMSGEKIEVEHNFRFFDEEGKFIKMQKYKSDNFFDKLVLKNPSGKSKYFSFIHFVESDISIKKIFKLNGISKLDDFCEQNRGYTIYYPNDNKFSGSSVHGNFGGISKYEHKRAKIRLNKYIFTPVYKFQNHNKYDLVFNNPTKSNLKIKIILNELGKNYYLHIPSLGTKFFNLDGYSGSISFESRLPVCRALVFKNPAPNSEGNFDVFHS